MPYIKQEQRVRLKDIGFIPPICNPGELNYLITELCKQYITTNGQSYQTYNDIIGALSCASMEIYRRKIAPYEDVKIEENGDVYS